MTKDLQSIFESITPDNIQKNPAIRDAMTIFIEVLNELSAESIEISNMFNNGAVQEELIQIHLNDLYNVLKNVENNKKIADAIDTINSYYSGSAQIGEPGYVEYLKKDSLTNFTNFINEEHYLTFAHYKRNKGTIKALKYIFELLYVFVNTEYSEFDFEINEGANPFELEIGSTLPKEFYDYIVYPLAHPLGFTYIYSQLISSKFQDFFPFKSIDYNVTLLEVRNLLPNDSYEVVRVFSENNSTQLVSVEFYNVGDNKLSKYTFGGGDYLVQTEELNGNISVVWYRNDTSVIEDFSVNYTQPTIYADYIEIIASGMSDDTASSVVPLRIGWFNIGQLDCFIGGNLPLINNDTISFEVFDASNNQLPDYNQSALI